MKVIFHKNVPGVARELDVKQVADGYALNFLFPRQLAVPATAREMTRLEEKKAGIAKKRQETEAVLAKNLKKIAAVTIEIAQEANEKGHLFKGIHKEEVVAELKKQAEIDVPADFIVIEKPIKDVGDHKIEVKAGDKNAFFTLTIKAL